MGYHKRHDKCVLFLEEGFGTTVHPEKLKQAGFSVVCFAEVFTAGGRKPEVGVKDPRIIRHCNSNTQVLVTFDKSMRYTHIEEIKKTEIAIIATESNRTTPSVWIDALIQAKVEIERKVKKHPRPWFAHLSHFGTLTRIQKITPEMKTRRTRPREK